MNAAEAAASGMGKLYLSGTSNALRLTCLIVAVLAAGALAQAQTSNETIRVPPLGSTLTVDALSHLPSSGGNLFTLLDTVIPEVITDRVDSGGLDVGGAARIGAHGSSWRQTLFRIDGVDITDGDGSGAPMLLPGVLMWDRVDVATGLLPIDINAPGLAISLTPRRPTSTWTRAVEGLAAFPSPKTGAWPTPKAPAIARVGSAANGNVLLSGPLVPDKVGVVLAGSFNAASRYERAETTAVDGLEASVFTHFVYTPNSRDEVRFLGTLQRTTAPFENRLAFGEPAASEHRQGAHAQLVWERRTADDRTWSAFAGYSVRERTFEVGRPTSIVINRNMDGPADALLYPGPGTDTHWSIGLRSNPSDARSAPQSRYAPAFGVELSGTGVRMRPAFGGLIGEMVEGLPTRIWEFTQNTVPAQWNETTLAVYASRRFQVHPRVRLDAGLRFEHLGGSAADVNGVSWNDLLPRAGVRWHLTDVGNIAAVAGYSRNAHRLALTDLAWSDPMAPTGNVYRWNTTTPATRPPLLSERGVLVSRVGPGAGTAANFSTLDPNLRRPHMDELTFGFEGRPRPHVVVRLMGMGRRERSLFGVVNTGVPESAYTVIPLSDTGLFGDGSVLPVFNRPVSTFGADRYELTNPDHDDATFVGAELTAQRQTDRLFLLFGLTAGRSEALSGYRGFRAIENDAMVLGDVFTNPNSRTYAQGRIFTERGYTIKVATVYRFDHDLRLGIAARYQDGQHFSRLIVVPDLNQGPELIRAFRNGRTRFTFTGTLDARVQKGLTSGPRRVALLLEGYNILNMAYEIEEFQLSGPRSRATTATQPPLSIHAGIRIEF
jgi:TonB dependent receptor-like, beta-barrel